MFQELADWRESFTIAEAKALCRKTNISKYSVAVMASGGLLDTLASIRAGFFPIWGCETDPTMQALWQDLTGVSSMGDAFKINAKFLRRPMLLKTGFPCIDWSTMGSQAGYKGETGHMYVRQAELILKISPAVVVIEQTMGVLTVENGKWFYNLIERLTVKYNVHYKTIDCWTYGDPSARTRLFIVAFHRDLGERGAAFKWPQPKYNEERYPTALDISDLDSEVPEEYLRYGEPKEYFKYSEPIPGKIHHVGNFGPGAGDSLYPHPLHSHWGLPATQLTSNGGSRRVMLDWEPGQHIFRTRLTTPRETLRMASLPNSYDEWIRSFQNDDRFLRKAVNNGVPLQTSYAIDMAIKQVLIEAIRPDIPVTVHSPIKSTIYADLAQPSINHGIRSMMLDTGASSCLNYCDIESHLINPRPSAFKIAVANGTAMNGSMDGKLQINVLNTAGYEGLPDSTPLVISTTTAKRLRSELFSIDGLYRSTEGGWSLMIRQPHLNGGISELYRPACKANGFKEQRVPLRHDKVHGGFYLDYTLPGEEDQAARQLLLLKHQKDTLEDVSELVGFRAHNT